MTAEARDLEGAGNGIDAAGEARGRRGRSGGGREARRASRAKPSQMQAPYITRNVPVYEVLSEEGLEIIEANADTIMEEIGIEFQDDAEALELWRGAGADVQGTRVHIPRGLARSLCATAPSSFTQHARNPARSVEVGGKNMIFAPVYGPPFVSDVDGGRRYATIEDFQNFVKLTYMLPSLHHSGGTVCEPVDLPVNKRHFDMVYAHMKYSDKPFMGSVTHPDRAQDTVDMAKILFGAEFVENNTVCTSLINANSPMVWDGTMLGALKTYARNNQACITTPFILAGAMSPVTVAGTLAQTLAEAMAGMAFTQLVRPGAPVIFGSFASSLSMQSGAPTFGTPEPAMVLYGCAQLARRLGVPFRSGGSLCGSKTPDAQAAYESAQTLNPTDLTENGQAMDAIREVGPGKHFLGCAHTQANFENAFFRSKVADNNTYEQWAAEGCRDAYQRTGDRVKTMLAEYQAPEIDPAVDEALVEFMTKRKASFPDSMV